MSTAEDVVKKIYELVTFEAGSPPDWDDVKALFLDEAVVVLRTSRTESTVFSVDGFIDDFKKFAERKDVQKNGFSEKILRTHATEFRDIAHVWVLYEASIPGTGRPPLKGADSFQLIRKDDRWRIASVANDIPTADHPIPEVLRD